MISSEVCLPGGDIYILKNILHDWDDKRSADILASCRRAMAEQAVDPSHHRICRASGATALPGNDGRRPHDGADWRTKPDRGGVARAVDGQRIASK